MPHGLKNTENQEEEKKKSLGLTCLSQVKVSQIFCGKAGPYTDEKDTLLSVFFATVISPKTQTTRQASLGDLVFLTPPFPREDSPRHEKNKKKKKDQRKE